MNQWPLQSQCDVFYGNPRGANGTVSEKWKAANLIAIKPPFKMRYAGKPVSSVTMHRKCSDSLSRVFKAIWEASGKSQAKKNQECFYRYVKTQLSQDPLQCIEETHGCPISSGLRKDDLTNSGLKGLEPASSCRRIQGLSYQWNAFE